MKITPLGKAILVLLGLTIIYFGARNFAPDIRKWALGAKAEQSPGGPASGGTGDDFGALKGTCPDPARGKGSGGVASGELSGSGKPGRPLVVAINTWAGHAPGVVYNGGLDAGPA